MEQKRGVNVRIAGCRVSELKRAMRVDILGPPADPDDSREKQSPAKF